MVCSVRKLQPKLSTGCDGIPSCKAKSYAESFDPVVTYIFSFSLQYRAYPFLWKMAVVIHILKFGNPHDVNNVRSMSRPLFVDSTKFLKLWFMNVFVPI